MVFIKARCFCPKHGKLGLDEILVKNGVPVCSKCYTELQFCEVRPRVKK
ncbi:MAG: hypothetical protein QW228_04545 [Candidatus Aenigmatarchaeota archaeon]